jgi:hypothetical protein
VEVLLAYSNQAQFWPDLGKLSDLKPSGPPRRVARRRQSQHRLDQEEILSLVADFNAGFLIGDLAKKYQIGPDTVRHHAKQAGVGPRYPAMTPDQATEATNLYLSGCSLADVGGQLGVNPSTVRTSLLKAGVRLRDTHGRDR